MTKHPNQSDKFKAAAKEAGADMSEAEFKKAVSTLAKSSPPKKGKAGSKPKRKA